MVVLKGIENSGNIDFNRLRQDLIDEYGAQMVSITGAMGFSYMCDAQNASEQQLLEMAQRENININNYRK